MLGVEAVAERMADHVVGHHPTMPGAGKTAQAVHSTRRLEDSLHASIMTIVPCLLQDDGRAATAEGTHSALSDGTRLRSSAVFWVPKSFPFQLCIPVFDQGNRSVGLCWFVSDDEALAVGGDVVSTQH